MSTFKIILIFAGVILVVLLFWLFVGRSIPSIDQTVSTSQDRTINNTQPKTDSSQPLPIEVGTIKGTIVSVDSKTLVVKADEQNYSLSIENIGDIQKVTSGSVDGGDATFTKATLTDLKADGQIIVAVDKNSNNARAIVILK